MAGDEHDVTFDPARGAVRNELLALLEICGLTGLAFTRPVLDSFGRAPETFLVRGAGARDVVLFAVAVAVVPALVAAVVGAAARVTGPAARRWAHLLIVGGLGGVVVWRFGTDVLSWRPTVLAVAGLLGALGVTVLRHRVPSTATYLRFLGAASVVFLVQFLVFSPAASLATGGDGPREDAAATDAVLGAADAEPPPIVMVVVDALPTAGLLDGTGAIDAELYPNLAELADGATWYRNNTTNSGWTYQAVPAMLTGRLPESPSPLPSAAQYPDNLFSLFAGTHRIEAVEQITRLCPSSACAGREQGALGAMLGDAVDWWRGALDTDQADGAQILPGALGPERGDDFARWIDAQDFSPSGDPGLWFYHLVMPHDPWDVLDDGSRYVGLEEEPYGLYLHSVWGKVGAEVARQRHVLQTQAVDRMLGDLFDALRAAGTYDETLVVVAGDHGQAYTEGLPLRGLAPGQYEQVAWTPLIVKAPGQAQGVVDDTNVWSIDLVPTLADTLGIDLPWDVDGIPARRVAEERDLGDKQVFDSAFHKMEPADGSEFVVIDGVAGLDRVLAADAVPGRGESAVWQRTAHGTLVGADVGGLDVGPDDDGTLAVEQLDRIEHRGDEPPLLEFLAVTGLSPGETVAITVNDVVAAVAPVVTSRTGEPIVHALLRPDSFSADNDLRAYRVEGSPGGETLRPLAVAGA